MKKIVIVTIAILIAATTLTAQTVNVFDVASIKLDTWKRAGDSVSLTLSVALNGQKLKSQKQADIRPVLRKSGNEFSMRQFSLMGKQRFKAYRRFINYRGIDTSYPEDPMFVMLADGSQDYAIYSFTAPYQEWMDEAKLFVDSEMCKCGDLHQKQSSDFLTDVLRTDERIIVKNDTIVQVDTLQIAPEPRIYELKCDLMLAFKVNRTNIRQEYGNNAAEIARVNEMLSKVIEDKDSKIKSVRVIGYASPEGPLLNNERLSKERSLVLVSYLAEKYDIARSKFSVEFGGENWQGLEEVVSKSEYSFKDEVIKVLNSTKDSELRKRRLKDYDGGRPYRILLKEVYPWLRRTEVIVEIEKTVQ